MGFPRGRPRTPAPARVHVAVFAVGARVHVACAGDISVPVTLMDEADKRSLARLNDGTEVAILAWRPGWSGTTRYRVRATTSGLEGWLPVANLRSTKVAIAPSPTAPPPVPPPPPAFRPAPARAGDWGHGFGQSRVAPRPAGSTPPDPSSAPARTADGGESRRRFGQQSE